MPRSKSPGEKIAPSIEREIGNEEGGDRGCCFGISVRKFSTAASINIRLGDCMVTSHLSLPYKPSATSWESAASRGLQALVAQARVN